MSDTSKVNYRLIAEKLHEISSFTKLIIIFIFFLVVNFGSVIWLDLKFSNHTALCICISITFLTNLISEILIFSKKRKYEDFHPILSIQLVMNTLLLIVFLVLIDHINGPLFLIFTLTLMESFLNLNLTIPPILVSIMMLSTVIEWLFLIANGQLSFTIFNTITLFVRIISLVFLSSYGKSFAESIIASREVDKMKDEFLSIASHELRTPMTSIKSYLWMVIQGKTGQLKPKQKFFLRRCSNSVDRLIDLVNNMLNVSRIESGRISLNPEKVDINNLITKAVNEVLPRAKQMNIKLKIKSKKSLPSVIADPNKIIEVLINLIGNALKFTPKKGLVTIDFKVSNNFLITYIRDTGSGMTREVINSLFQKFGLISGSYQINQTSSSQGSGLGLYISKQIIKLHDGNIWAKSKGIGYGSTIGFSLPIYTPDRLKEFRKRFSNKFDIGLIHTTI